MTDQKTKTPRGIGLALMALLATTGCAGTTVKPGEMGLKYVVLDEPALQAEVRPEGFYFQWPWNDMVIYDVTWQSRDEEVAVLTADDLHVPTTVTVTFRPESKRLHDLHTLIGPTYYEDVIRPALVTLARSEFALHKHNDLAREGPKIEQEVLKKLRELLKGKPLELEQVAIKHIQYDQLVTRSISDKLAMEQKAKQKEFELKVAERDAEIARTRAKGISDAVAIRAEGDSKAIVLRGEAQAKAQEAIDKTLTQKYIQYRAFEGDNTRYYFVPIGKDGLPLIVNAEAAPSSGRRK
tara:strand:- start:1072 stop:1956 length:885 start_codon:yes stop_codon:yes gene_type:complete